MRDKPFIDRDKCRREERRREVVFRVADDAAALLAPGETLGKPVRQGNDIVIAVTRDREGAKRRSGVRPRSMTDPIYTTWFESGVI